MAKDANNNLTVSRVKSKRLLLTVSAVSVLICAVVVLVSLIVGGFEGGVLAMPITLLLLDVIFLLLVVLSNFRFKYARSIPIVHIVLTTVFTFAAVATDGTIFTTAAQTLIIVLHILASVTTVFCYKRARMEGVNGNGSRLIATVMLSILIVFGAIYSVAVIANGWFGQGAGELRTLVYELTDDGEAYEVVDVLEGRGDTAVIPESFNGKPVRAVECEAFADEKIKSVYIECDGLVVLNNPDALYVKDGGRTVYVKDFDEVRGRILRLAATRMDENYLLVADAMRPSGLGEDECYVSFSYTLDDLVATGGNSLPSWFGKRGDVISEKFLSSVEYANHKYDINAPESKYWAYDNIDKRIYTGIDFGGEMKLGDAVFDSVANARVSFAPLYCVRFAPDNDTLYELSRELTHFGDRELILTSSEANEYLGGFDNRGGFDLNWHYTVRVGSLQKAILVSLEDEIYDGITLHPTWSMRAPTISSATTDKPEGAAIYGDDVSFLSTVAAADPSFALSYEWRSVESGELLGSSDSFILENAYPTATGRYRLTVVSSADGVSSLTSSSSTEVSLTVGKRAIALVWSEPEDDVYSGYDKTVSVAHDGAYVINGDVITLAKNDFTAKNAADYHFLAELTGECASLYYVTGDTVSYDYTVTPATVPVSWTGDSFTFCGNYIAPTASATGLAEDGQISVYVVGQQINVGSYVATAKTGDTNYILENEQCEYEILPYAVDVIWSGLTAVYNGLEQRPSATAKGLDEDSEVFASGGTLAVTVPESYKDSAEGYSVSAVISNPNYIPTEQTATASFTIEKMPVSLSWSISSTGNLYSGRALTPKASAVCVSGEVILFDYTYSGTESSATAPVAYGTYGVVASLADGFAVNENYVIASGESLTFTIDQLPVDISWKNPDNLVYDGSIKQVEIDSFGVSDELTEQIFEVISVTGNVAKNRGEYTASASLPMDCNFKIASGASHGYEITACPIALEWSLPDSMIYDGTEKKVTVSSAGLSGEIEAEALADVTVSDGSATYYSEGGYTARASLRAQSNFVIISGESFVFAIEKRPISLSWTSATDLVYNGHEQSVYLSSYGTDDKFTYEIPSQINVSGNTATYYRDGGYEASAYLDEGSSFVIVSGEKYSFEIKKCPVRISWQMPADLIYDGKEKSPTVSDYGVNTELSMQLADLITVSGAHIDAGEHTVTASLPDGSSFEIISGDSAAYTIAPREISLVWCDCNLIYNGAMQSVYVTEIINHIEGGTTSILSYTGATQSEAGAYVAYASAGSNYTIVDGESHSFEIAKRALGTTIVLEDERPMIYDGKAWSYIARYDSPSSDAPVFKYEYKKDGVTLPSAPTDAGSYTVTVTLLDRGEDENYTFAPVTISFTVLAREVVLSWSLDGNAPIATGGGVSLSYTYYEVVDGERVALEGAPTAAGEYVCIAESADANYTVSEESAEYAFTISAPQENGGLDI